MSFWIIAGAMAALTGGLSAAPLHYRHPKLAVAIVILVPLASLGLYLLIGNPGLAR